MKREKNSRDIVCPKGRKMHFIFILVSCIFFWERLHFLGVVVVIPRFFHILRWLTRCPMLAAIYTIFNNDDTGIFMPLLPSLTYFFIPFLHLL